MKNPGAKWKLGPGRMILNCKNLKPNKIMKKLIIVCICFACAFNSAWSQDKTGPQVKVTVWDGMMVAGYVNRGAYVNFGGPTLKLVRKPWNFGFGILPTMRIKEDQVPKGAPKNSIVTPTAGFGFTIAYKHFVFQVPFYYNPKSATVNGKWNPGVGIGFKVY
jgi:hypothetical protein